MALLALIAIGVGGIWLLIQWFLSGPRAPDPWDAQTSEAMEGEDARPLCHRCLAPNEREADFCSECGAAIGQYTNWLPYPYIFSLGHTLRIGTAGEFRRSPWLVFGFMLLAVAEYTVFAPVYWCMLLFRLKREPKNCA